VFQEVNVSDIQQLRMGLKEATDSLDQTQSRPGKPVFTYVPPSHARALDPDATLVEGIRGAGKTFWWAQLASTEHREFVRTAFPEARLPTQLRVARGFGVGLAITEAPSPDVLAELILTYRPRSIWRAVLALHAGFLGEFAQLKKWSERVQWVQTHAEDFDTQLEQIDRAMESQGETLLVLFDALDRLADDWQHINPLAKALLQVALDVRSTRRIRCKVFVRPDILQDQTITGFPDYSKLLAGKADLRWRRADLYALLFQRLANSESGGAQFRQLISDALGEVLKQQATGWVLSAALRSDEKMQEMLFERLAGKAMGSSIKRGKPYTWLVNHLQDGLDQVSPRSFFAALKSAAEETSEDYSLVLDYRRIQSGVQRASQIRVTEIKEDYPWVQLVMAPLRGRLIVPCEAREFDTVWREENTLGTLEITLKSDTDAVKLPPQNLDKQSAGVLVDLASLGLVQQMEDRRIQMPDVYRLAFGFGRRGGIKPLK
jgi:hypothetical protein